MSIQYRHLAGCPNVSEAVIANSPKEDDNLLGTITSRYYQISIIHRNLVLSELQEKLIKRFNDMLTEHIGNVYNNKETKGYSFLFIQIDEFVKKILKELEGK